MVRLPACGVQLLQIFAESISDIKHIDHLNKYIIHSNDECC